MAEEKAVLVSRDPLVAAIEPALKVGAACGTAGFLFGGAAGIIKGTAPFLFASASGIQTFALGATFWGSRTAILQAWTPQQQIPSGSDRARASALSGGVTGGAIALLTRGRSNVIPGALMFSLFGYIGQTALNSFATRPLPAEEPKQGFWRRMSEKSWSPVTVMSDEEYVVMLENKMMKVDVELSILEDKITALRRQQDEQTKQASEPPVPHE